jgi:hypothetical protein
MNLKKQREYYAGGLMTLRGLASAYVAMSYDVGTLTNMGSGFFPLVLSVLLALLGVAIALTAGETAAAPEAHGLLAVGTRTGPDWRGWTAILMGVGLFIVLAEYAGLAPATFACVFVAAMGDRGNTWKQAGLLALGVTVFAIAVFSYGLRIQIPIFGRL